jgi:hypothetical protein
MNNDLIEKVKSSFARVKRLVFIALSIYVIVMLGRFIYKIYQMVSK